MSYGSFSYGSTAVGGSVNSIWRTFFPFQAWPSDTLLTIRGEFSNPSGQYSLFTAQGNDLGQGIEYRAYCSNDPGETPQLQSVFAGVGQAVIPAARFITVTVLVDSNLWGPSFIFGVRGRPGQ